MLLFDCDLVLTLKTGVCTQINLHRIVLTFWFNSTLFNLLPSMHFDNSLAKYQAAETLHMLAGKSGSGIN